MTDKTEILARLAFWRSALEKLRDAYIALLDGGAKSYKLGSEELTHLDLASLAKRIEEAEAKVDELTTLANGGHARCAFAVVPRDW